MIRVLRNLLVLALVLGSLLHVATSWLPWVAIGKGTVTVHLPDKVPLPASAGGSR